MVMDAGALTAEIRNFIVENFLFGDTANPLNDEDSFLENGIIDSTGVLELVSHLEATFEIKVEDEELIPDNLDSIANVVRYLERKLAKG